MHVVENKTFTREYLEPDKRAIGNAVQVFFKDGGKSERVAVDYPIGHRRRRVEGIPLLVRKFEAAIGGHFSTKQATAIRSACAEQSRLEAMAVSDFMDLWYL